MNYRKKSPPVQAVQYTDSDSVKRIMEMIGTAGVNNTKGGLFIIRSGGTIRMKKGEWMIKETESGIKLFVCSPEYFEQYYEKVEG